MGHGCLFPSVARARPVSLGYGVPRMALSFDDLPPDEMIEFLNAARERHPGYQPGGPTFGTSGPDFEWGCGSCGREYPIDSVLVANAEPECPFCGAKGWEWVHPRRDPQA
jgi:hypothetical protein